MAMTIVGQRDSNKSLPADIRTAFEPRMWSQGMARLNRNADVVQNSRSWGMRGLGCDPDAGDLTGCDFSALTDPLQDPTVWGNDGWLQWGDPQSGSTGHIPYVPPAPGGGVDAAAIARIIAAGAGSIVPIIAATSQGVLYKVDPKTGAMTVYSQPAGSNINLPVGGGGPVGSFNTPLGSGSVAGVDSGTLLMLGGLALVALLALKR